MPRSSLPSSLESLKTIEVKLTKTTEEDLKQHFQKMYESFETNADYFRTKFTKLIDDMYESNKYEYVNWKKIYMNGDLELKYSKGCYAVLNDEEEELYENIKFLHFDLTRCIKILKWNEEDYLDFLNDIEKCKLILDGLEQDLKDIELMTYRRCKSEWENNNKEWVEEQKLQKCHKLFHKSLNWYIQSCEKDPDMKRWYEERGGLPNYHETCKFCIHEKKVADECHRRYVDENKVFEEEMLKIEEDMKKKEQDLILLQQINHEKLLKEVHCHTCECMFASTFDYNDHLKSKEHKEKLLYCKICDHNSRWESEHIGHLKSKKHIAAVTQAEKNKVTFVCEKCNYSTPYKHVYENHLKSKKHNA